MKISNKAITNKFLIKSFFIAILIIGASAMVVFAWTEPTLSPPDGNASAPINIGTTSQSKLGNLGIGTTTVSYPLTVNGIVQIGTNLYLNSGTTKYLYASGNELRIGSLGGGGFISFYGNDGTNREMMRMTGASLGIGTTIPSYKLDVGGEGSFGAAGSTSQIHYVATPTADSDAATKGYVDSYSGSYWTRTDGNIYPTTLTDKIGIGTTIPSTNLDIDGQIKIRGGVPGVGKVLTSDAVGLATWSAASAVSDGDWTISSNDQYSAVSGNVGIGIATPTYKLDLDGTFRKIYRTDTNTNNFIIGSGYELDGTLHAAGGYKLYTRWGNNGYGDGGWDMIFGTAAHPVLSLVAGNVGAGTNAPYDNFHMKAASGVASNLQLQNAEATTINTIIGSVGSQVYDSKTINTKSFARIDFVTDNPWYTGAITFRTNNSDGTGDAPVERMRINRTGNVGIGTTIPSYKLDVRGEVAVGTAGSTNQIHYVATPVADSDAATKGYADSIITAGSYWTKTASDDHIYNNNTGNVGIGTTVPTSKLTINSSSSDSTGGIRLMGNTTPADISYWSERQFAMQYGGVYKNTIDSNGVSFFNGGNVGIGTTVPVELLHLKKDQAAYTNIKIENVNSAGAAQVFMINDLSSAYTQGLYGSTHEAYGAVSANGGFTYFNGAGGLTLMADNVAGIIKFATGGNGEKMRLNNSGMLGIGTTIPSYKLDVRGEISAGANGATNQIHYVATPAASSDAATKGYVDSAITGGDNDWELVGGGDPTLAGDIYHTGNVGIGTTSPINGKLEVESSIASMPAIYGKSSVWDGIQGVSVTSGKYGVYGYADTVGVGTAAAGVYGATGSDGKSGVYGYSIGGTGGYGIYGQNASTNGTGVYGVTGTSGTAIYGLAGSGGYAGIFMGGNVGIGTTGPTHTLQVNGYNTTGTSVINTGGNYNFTNPPTTYPRSLGLGIISGPVTADIPLSGLTDWKAGYGGYIGIWSDVTAATEGSTNAAGVVSILRGTPTGSNAFGFYSDLSNFSGAGGNTKYGIYSTGETYDYFAGNVGIGTTNPITDLYVNGTAQINDQLNMNGADIIGVDKLTVSTIDPVYEIDGIKYATYVSDFAGGVRTETTGVIKIKNTKYEIDFDNLKTGSDLWLFWQSSSKNLDDLVVILTPNFEGKVWYKKSGNRLTIYGDKSGEISYRLTAPRRDYQDWTNFVKD